MGMEFATTDSMVDWVLWPIYLILFIAVAYIHRTEKSVAERTAARERARAGSVHARGSKTAGRSSAGSYDYKSIFHWFILVYSALRVCTFIVGPWMTSKDDVVQLLLYVATAVPDPFVFMTYLMIIILWSETIRNPLSNVVRRTKRLTAVLAAVAVVVQTLMVVPGYFVISMNTLWKISCSIWATISFGTGGGFLFYGVYLMAILRPRDGDESAAAQGLLANDALAASGHAAVMALASPPSATASLSSHSSHHSSAAPVQVRAQTHGTTAPDRGALLSPPQQSPAGSYAAQRVVPPGSASSPVHDEPRNTPASYGHHAAGSAHSHTNSASANLKRTRTGSGDGADTGVDSAVEPPSPVSRSSQHPTGASVAVAAGGSGMAPIAAAAPAPAPAHVAQPQQSRVTHAGEVVVTIEPDASQRYASVSSQQVDVTAASASAFNSTSSGLEAAAAHRRAARPIASGGGGGGEGEPVVSLRDPPPLLFNHVMAGNASGTSAEAAAVERKIKNIRVVVLVGSCCFVLRGCLYILELWSYLKYDEDPQYILSKPVYIVVVLLFYLGAEVFCSFAIVLTLRRPTAAADSEVNLATDENADPEVRSQHPLSHSSESQASRPVSSAHPNVQALPPPATGTASGGSDVPVVGKPSGSGLLGRRGSGRAVGVIHVGGVAFASDNGMAAALAADADD